jgi:hypothetical protein
VKRKELMQVIQDVTIESGLETDPEFAAEFALDLVARLEEEFGLINEEDDEDSEEDQ